MFTFSFGSAFATVPTDANKVAAATLTTDITDAAQAAKDAELKKMNDQIYVIFGTASKATAGCWGHSITLTKNAVTAAFQKVYDKTAAQIDAAMNAKLAAMQAAIIADNATGNPFSGYFDATNSAQGTAEDGYPLVDADWTDYSGDYTPVNYGTELYKDTDWRGTEGSKDAALDAQLTADKAATIAVIEGIEKTLDTTYSKDAKGTTESNYDKAKKDVTSALNAIATLVVTNVEGTDDCKKYAEALNALASIYTAPVNQADPTGYLYVGGNSVTINGIQYTFTGLNNISKTTAEPTEAAKLQWAQTLVLDVLTSQINSAKSAYVTAQNNAIIEESLKTTPVQATIDTAKANIEKAEEGYAAALEIVTYLVKDCDDYTKLLTVNSYTFTSSTVKSSDWAFSSSTDNSLTDDTLKVPADSAYAGNHYWTSISDKVATYNLGECLAITKKVDALEADAALAKKSVELDGTTYAEIDASLEKAIKETYYGNSAAAIKKSSEAGLLTDRKAELIGNANNTSNNDTVKVNNKVYNAVESWDKDLDAGDNVYNKDKYDAVRTVLSETKAAVKAATTIADAEKAFLDGLDKLDAVPTKADQALAQAKKEFSDLKTKYTKDITNYLEYKDAGLAANTYAYTKADFLRDDINKDGLLNTLDDAYTVEELTAAYEAAIKNIDGLKTKAELKTVKDDLEKRIAALPTAATVADAETVDALRAEVKAHNEYCDMIGNTTEKVVIEAPLNAAELAIKNAEAKAIKDAYDVIVKDGKVSANEKAAVEELRKAFDAYCAKYTPENADNSQLVTTASSVDKDDIETLENAVYTAEADAVKEMIAVLDVVNVDAAAVKAARDAYDALNVDYQFGGEYYDKLVALEKVLSVDVKAIKIKASSTAKKGSITVTWTVTGNKTAADGYEIWKSTKVNKGFKKAFTTTKTTYKNTKDLKKGTRYYYKVRAYKMVDGVKVTSDWSNKAYRKAK